VAPVRSVCRPLISSYDCELTAQFTTTQNSIAKILYFSSGPESTCPPACLAGWLGGLALIADFNPLLQMASGVYLTFFGSFVFGTPGFPLSDVPLQAIAAKVEPGHYQAKPSRVFRFDEIREAHRVMEANEANGKLVVCA
jgi:Zinc-binding dehydrogenase